MTKLDPRRSRSRLSLRPATCAAAAVAAMQILLLSGGGARAAATAASSSLSSPSVATLRRTIAFASSSYRPPTTLRAAETAAAAPTAAVSTAAPSSSTCTPYPMCGGASFGIQPHQYRPSISPVRRRLSVQSAANGTPAPGSDPDLQHEEQDGGGGVKAATKTAPHRPRTLTSAVLSSSSSSSAPFAPYTLPPPRPGDDVMTDLRPGRRVVAIGDVHGDIDALRTFLVTAEIMDPSSTVDDPIWSGGDAICVQTGDVLDRGDDELACLRLLVSLAHQARNADGDLILLYGNHETLNTAGLFQYANPGGNVEFEVEVGNAIDGAMGNNRWRLMFAGNQPSRWAALEPGGLLAGNCLASMKVAVVIGRTVFVHAGLTADHLRQYGGIERMNKVARDWVVQPHHGENNYEGKYETVAEVIESAQKRARGATRKMPECLGGGLGGNASPVWMRDYSNPNDDVPSNPAAQRMMDEALAEVGHGVQRMVMGHTPQHRINAALGGRAWRVDVGASRGVMGGTPEVLEIIHGGDGEEDVVTVLTASGERVSAAERQVIERLI